MRRRKKKCEGCISEEPMKCSGFQARIKTTMRQGEMKETTVEREERGVVVQPFMLPIMLPPA